LDTAGIVLSEGPPTEATEPEEVEPDPEPLDGGGAFWTLAAA
jgi:hypothetical protein